MNARLLRRVRTARTAAGLAFLALLGPFCFPVAALACKTPVYRYALYNWRPSPYRVYYLHSGEKIPAGDARTNAAIINARDGKPAANIELHVVRVDDPASLDALPAAARNEAADFIADLPPDQLPRYVVVDPNAGQLHSGPLTDGEVSALVDSPIRRQANRLIEQGHAAVFVLLTGKDAKANARAEKEIDSIIKAVADGKIEAPKLPGDDPSASEPEPAAPPPLKIASLKLVRDDPSERWLVRCLLQVEDDLSDSDEPMVFAVYGQCRANPPLVGDGIDSEQLATQIKFVLGPCTCTIKEQNVGLDVLARHDWPSVALSLAKKVGPETGNEHLLGADAFPNLFPKLHDAPSLDAAAATTKSDSPAGNSASSGQAERKETMPLLDEESRYDDGPLQGYQILGVTLAIGIALLAAATLVLVRMRRV
jgi:hypothetical protein